jgi:hypothetical protein
MAVPSVNDRQIQLLFTDEYVYVNNISDEAKMLRVAEAVAAVHRGHYQ